MPDSPKSSTRFADQKLKPTLPSEWKTTDELVPADKVGFITELPSGNIVRMTRTMDLPVLLKTGNIPNPLAGIVQNMIDQRSSVFPVKEADNKVLMQMLDLLNETAVRCVLEPQFDAPPGRGKDPKIGKNETAEEYQERLANWEPAEGKISAWLFTMDDRFYIFAVAQGAAADLASFREEQARAMANLQSSGTVRKPTKRTGGGKPKR